VNQGSRENQLEKGNSRLQENQDPSLNFHKDSLSGSSEEIGTEEWFDENRFYQGLETKLIGRKLLCFPSLPSTQTKAKELALDWVEEGTIVLSEEQTAGKGRMLRHWHSPKGEGLWFSLILRPQLSIHRVPQLTLLTAVACVQAIEEASGMVGHIKWPNDIYIKGKKVCGILTELETERNQVHSIIIGVGINVNQRVFPLELADKAASLFLLGKKRVDRNKLLQHFCRQFEKLYETYLTAGFHPIKLLWEGYALSIGKEITARTPQGNYEGLALGIDDDGVLQLQLADGTIKQIHSADIEIMD